MKIAKALPTLALLRKRNSDTPTSGKAPPKFDLTPGKIGLCAAYGLRSRSVREYVWGSRLRAE